MSDARKRYLVTAVIDGRASEFAVKALDGTAAVFLAGFTARKLGVNFENAQVMVSVTELAPQEVSEAAS